MRINIDSDGVVYDLTSKMAEKATLLTGRTDFDAPDEWAIGQAWGLPSKTVSKIFAWPGLFATGDPVEGAIEAVSYLADRHDVRIVTHKAGLPNPSRARMETIDWYTKHGLSEKVDFVFARGDKTTYPADIVVDDKPTMAWAQPAPTLNIVFAQPWNHKNLGALDESTPWRIEKAFSWNEVCYLVEEEGRKREAWRNAE